jgi:ABC-2 type transport system ATP-binding protein
LARNTVISVKDLIKDYGQVRALNGISFEVPKGEVFGLLGPNGAGKTTTIRILTTLLPPSGGEALVFGYDVIKNSDDIRRRIGYVQQQLSVELFMTVEENLDIYGLLWGVRRQERMRRANFLAEMFGLKDVLNIKALELSLGQRKRLQVAREFMHDMELLFLDEPTVGLDPIMKRTLLDFIREKTKTEGFTVFFTTHNMSEAEYLCDRIAIIDKGRLLACGSTEELKKKFGVESILEIVVQEKDGKVIELLESISGVKRASKSTNGRSIRISIVDPYSKTPEILNVLLKEGYHVTELYVKEPTLEDVFIQAVRQGGS